MPGAPAYLIKTGANDISKAPIIKKIYDFLIVFILIKTVLFCLSNIN